MPDEKLPRQHKKPLATPELAAFPFPFAVRVVAGAAGVGAKDIMAAPALVSSAFNVLEEGPVAVDCWPCGRVRSAGNATPPAQASLMEADVSMSPVVDVVLEKSRIRRFWRSAITMSC